MAALFYSPVDFTDASDMHHSNACLMHRWINRWIKQRSLYGGRPPCWIFQIYSLCHVTSIAMLFCFTNSVHGWDITTHWFGKINVRHTGILLSISTISLYSAWHSTSGSQISSKSDHPQRRYDVISIFKIAGAAAQFYFRFRIWWRRSLQKVRVYQETKFLSYSK